MSKGIQILFLSIGVIGFTALLLAYTTDNGTVIAPENNFVSSVDTNIWVNQHVVSRKFDKTFDFAGEVLPTENFDIYERLDRELMVNSYWHSNTIQVIKLSNRFFPMIEKILAEEGIPDDFKYLAVAESGLRNVTSPAGARGIWQFMKGTGLSMGLIVNSEVDERYHYEKATRAACKYLKKLHNKFNSWTLAAAAYNRGDSGLQKEMNAQQATNYYDLNLNQETARYVFRIVALKKILSNQEKFGFHIDYKYPPLDNVIKLAIEESNINLATFAKENGISYRTLKQYNPWLKGGSLTNSSKRKYLIDLPKN